MRPNELRIPWKALSLATLLLLFAASPVWAQRGRTGGERKQETKKEETQPAPAPRAEPERRREPTQRSEPTPQTERRTPTSEPSRTTPARSTERSTERGRTTERTRTTREAPHSTGRTAERDTETTRGREADRTVNRTTDRSRVTRSTDARGETSRVSARGVQDRGGRVVRPVKRPAQRVERDHRNHRRVERRRYTWQHIAPVPHRGYRYRPAAPVIILDFDWPWEYRARRAWSPRYRYRQVVYIDAGYGGRYWDSRLDVRTTYRQRVRHANGRTADLDLDIESIELYQDGRYLGRVTRIPDSMSRVRARVHRNGRITFDREVFVVGSREVGFELIATDRYDGYVLSDWRRGDDFDVARLDLRRNRVQRVRQSRFFDPYGFSGYAPVSVLPEDERWLGDYGAHAPSTYPYDDEYYDDYGYDDSYYYGYEQGGGQGYRFDQDSALTLRGDSEDTFETPGGAQIHIRREAEIQRIE